MSKIYNTIITATKNNKKLLAVLIDPDKMELNKVPNFIAKVNQSTASHIFVGGSTVEEFETEKIVLEVKKHTKLPVILFPGDLPQLTDKADGLLFLSLISGRNPEYLIGKHVKAIPKLKHVDLEVLPTGYILIENGRTTSVEQVTGTEPMSRDNIPLIIDTAKAGELLGMKLIYLEAGSGAIHAVNKEIISRVKRELDIPLIVGGGIKTKNQIEIAHHSGADIVVIGTAFEDNEDFLEELKK